MVIMTRKVLNIGCGFYESRKKRLMIGLLIGYCHMFFDISMHIICLAQDVGKNPIVR